MDADERGCSTRGASRLRLSTLLVLGPLLAIVIALGSWVQSLRQEIAQLEQRVVTLEINQPLTTLTSKSNVGVPADVDRAMMLDSTRSIPMEIPGSSPIRAY